MSASSNDNLLRDRLISDARALSPTALNFDRDTESVRTGGGTRTNVSRIERWDGKAWTLISQNGKAPTAAQRREAEKLAASAPVPGYHRLAGLLATGAVVGAQQGFRHRDQGACGADVGGDAFVPIFHIQ